ncbi:hypothetical protein LX36DRAFT_60518 [Colletotrichum falcatum]|nr:hypothetical protein LX36DRAFT_60518 [Colletotrichum falcatum]
MHNPISSLLAPPARHHRRLAQRTDVLSAALVGFAMVFVRRTTQDPRGLIDHPHPWVVGYLSPHLLLPMTLLAYTAGWPILHINLVYPICANPLHSARPIPLPSSPPRQPRPTRPIPFRTASQYDQVLCRCHHRIESPLYETTTEAPATRPSGCSRTEHSYTSSST